MSAEVRTGSSLSVALQRSLLRTPLSGQAITPTATLATLATAPTTDPDEAVVVHTLRATHALGGPIAATLDGSSALLRERAAIRSEAMAYSAQARLSARVLTSVPLGFAGWSLLSSYSFRMALLSPPGLASASIGALCNLGGWWWMHRIIRKAGE
jgi:Flp pilus assembly protein TadB